MITLVTEHDFGGEKWVAVQARKTTVAWLTPDEAKALGHQLMAMYGPRSKVGTLAVETVPDEPGLWLCADYGKGSVPIARFNSDEAARQFTDLFSLARSVSHAQGQMGI